MRPRWAMGRHDAVAFWIGKAEHPVPPDPKSNLHFCFDAPTRESVDAFHAAALSTGGSDNGKPGLRADYGAHFTTPAFAIDPDGYRIEALLRPPQGMTSGIARSKSITETMSA